MANLAIPAGVEAAYNGFVWNNSTQTLLFSGRPVWDSAGRTIVYTNFTLTLTCVIQALPTDAIVRDAIARLTQPACALRYNGRGVGNVFVNVNGANDCAWGPKPGEVTAKPYGGGNATRLTWTVSFAIPTCNDGRYSGPSEFLYSVEVVVDKSGYSKRTYKGHLVIAQTRIAPGNRTVASSADQWRERIDPPLLAGFQRTDRVFNVSEDQNRLDFNIRDEQIGPNYPPAGVVTVEASHTYRMAGPGKIFQWVGTLEATYEVALNASVDAAVNAFWALANDRILAARGAGFGAVAALFAKPISFWPLDFNVSDARIYDKPTVRIVLQYTTTGPDLATILTRGGLWRPVPGSNWDTWATSLAVPVGPRGWATGLRFTPGEDTIVDLCAGLTLPPAGGKRDVIMRGARGPLKNFQIRGGVKINWGDPPTPRTSWLNYDVGIEIDVASNVVVGSALPLAPLSARSTAAFNAKTATVSMPLGTDASFFPPATDVVAGDGSSASQSSSAGGTFVQQRTLPVVYVFLTGSALRIGYPVPVPTLSDVNGAPLVVANRTDRGEGFAQKIVSSSGFSGVPVYGAWWRIRYVLPVPPSVTLALAVPPNPVIS